MITEESGAAQPSFRRGTGLALHNGAIAQTGYQGATSLEPMNWGYEALSPEEFLCAAVERARQLASLRGPAAF